MSVKQKFDIKDKALEKKEFANYRLSIELSFNGFSYCILDTNSNSFIAFESFLFKSELSDTDLLFEVKKIVQNNKLLNQPYKDINVLYVGYKSTLIPNELFDEKQKDKYLKLNYSINSDEIVLHQNLFNLKANNIYAIPEKIKTGIESIFKNVKIGHYSGGLIENILFQNKEKEDKVYLHVQKNHFDIIYLKGKKLELFNHYKYRDTDEFAYNLMFVLNQLKINTENQDVIVLGEIDKQSDEIKLISKYLKRIFYGLRNETFRYSPLFEEMPKHYYYNLLNFHL